jgi:hypothetical protein
MSEALIFCGIYSEWLREVHIHCTWSFLTIFDFVSYLVSFADASSCASFVYKHIFASIFWCDKTEAFLIVEEFYCSFIHCNVLLKDKGTPFSMQKVICIAFLSDYQSLSFVCGCL